MDNQGNYAVGDGSHFDQSVTYNHTENTFIILQKLKNDQKFWRALQEILENWTETIFQRIIYWAEVEKKHNFAEPNTATQFMECINSTLAHLRNGRDSEASEVLFGYIRKRFLDDANFKNELRDAVAAIMSEVDEKGSAGEDVTRTALHLANQQFIWSRGDHEIYMAILNAAAVSAGTMKPIKYVMDYDHRDPGGGRRYSISQVVG